VHRRAHWKYDERLEYPGLIRLERRRVRSNLIETFKIMKGHYDVHHDLWFELDEDGRRGHDQKLFNKRLRLNSRKYVFSISVHSEEVV